MEQARAEHRGRRHPAAIALGVGLIVVALGSVAFVFFMLGGERGRLDALAPLAEGDLSGLRPGQQVLLTATVSARNRHLVRDLVIACEEENYDSTWRVRRRYNQPLIVDHGGSEITVALRQPCPRGGHKTIKKPVTGMWRWVGITRGAGVTIVGKITSASPAMVSAADYFVGGVDDYRGYLSRVRWYVLPLAALLIFVGVLIMAKARRRRAAL